MSLVMFLVVRAIFDADVQNIPKGGEWVLDDWLWIFGSSGFASWLPLRSPWTTGVVEVGASQLVSSHQHAPPHPSDPPTPHPTPHSNQCFPSPSSSLSRCFHRLTQTTLSCPHLVRAAIPYETKHPDKNQHNCSHFEIVYWHSSNYSWILKLTCDNRLQHLLHISQVHFNLKSAARPDELKRVLATWITESLYCNVESGNIIVRLFKNW